MNGTLPSIEQVLPKQKTLFYAGKWQKPKDGKYRPTISPCTGNIIDNICDAGAADTEAAIEAAAEAFKTWKLTTGPQRASLLKKTAVIVRQHAAELALLDSYNTGNPIAAMLQDADIAAAQLDYFAGLIPMIKGETIPQTEATFNYTLREPIGVVARIVAFNHPIMFTVAKLAAPLAAGNTVVIKLPDQAPLSGLRLAELLEDVFPPGVVNILAGRQECGQVLSTHPLVRMITLIGSVPTAKLIAKAAGNTLKQTLFELGGKNALIAFPDADIEKLIVGIGRGMNYVWAGQSCGSTSRVFLHDSIYDQVLDRVVEFVRKEFKAGDSTDMSTTMGPVVSKASQDRVLAYIESAKQEGARLVCGGSKANLGEAMKDGFFIEPTIFADVKPTMKIAREEIFGPVMSVFRWTDEDTMLRDVNSTEYGLTASVWTNNIAVAQDVVKKVEVGFVWINTTGQHFLGVPFGGVKESGGGREECLEELMAFTQTKSVNVSLAR